VVAGEVAVGGGKLRSQEPKRTDGRTQNVAPRAGLTFILFSCKRYISVILHPRCTTPKYYTEQNSVFVQYPCFSIIQYFVILGVRLDDTERCSVLLSIFSAQF